MKAFFLGPADEACFVVSHGLGDVERRGIAVLYVPPFAEEANKARRMASLQARAWAKKGVATLLLDLCGTGDSVGEFEDARWEKWMKNVADAAAWLRSQGLQRLWLWGLRTGALLAAHVVKERMVAADGLILWQPVLSGKNFIRWFLRLRVAAGLSGKTGETTRELMERLEAGESVQVAGYGFHPDLARSLASLDLAALAPPAEMPVWWFEVSMREDVGLGMASRRVVDGWGDAGVKVKTLAVRGSPFWMTQEVEVCDELMEKNMAVFASCGDGDGRDR